MVRKSFVHIRRALPDLFHYLDNPSIPKPTNSLESFFGHLKTNLRLHRGLSKEHFKNYVKWYLFFKNNKSKYKKMSGFQAAHLLPLISPILHHYLKKSQRVVSQLFGIFVFRAEIPPRHQVPVSHPIRTVVTGSFVSPDTEKSRDDHHIRLDIYKKRVGA
jgi:hypothetical protein